MASRKPSRKVGVPPPYALAMVVCDAIWRDPATSKHTILGSFSSIVVGVFPHVQPLLAVYAVLTDGRGKVKIKFQIIDAEEENEPISIIEQETEFPDPRAMLELALHISNVQFPKAGEYRLQLFAGGEFVLERRLMVIQLQAHPQQPENEGD